MPSRANKQQEENAGHGQEATQVPMDETVHLSKMQPTNS